MLYATTRNPNDICTAYRALHTLKASDGGLYIPFRLKPLEREQLRQLGKNSFGQNVAQILNLFFSAGVSGWDVEFAVGRNPIPLVNVTSRLTVAECWRNAGGEISHLVKTLVGKLSGELPADGPGSWGQIAVESALLFGIIGELLQIEERLPDSPVDLAVTSYDFTLPMAAWFGKKLGLPIGNIICGCNANGSVWELVHHGQLETGGAVVHTATPLCDLAVPGNLERLVACTLGEKEVRRFLVCCREGDVYSLESEPLETLRDSIYAGVISDSRVKSLLPSVYQTSGYLLSPYGALAYGSLMDYRAKTRESRGALLLADRSPVKDIELVCACTKLSGEAVRQLCTGK